MHYTVSRTCQQCQHIDSFEVTKTELAFELFDIEQIRAIPCTHCGSMHQPLISYPMVEIDQELLGYWGHDENLAFLSQDEELILAEMRYLPMLLEAIDYSSYLPDKKLILVEAVCVLLYHSLLHAKTGSKKLRATGIRNAEVISAELIQRQQLVSQCSAGLPDYIKQVVFPQIGLGNSPDSE